uniref:Uncharacterized protein n=1 Tax=viral metagenome TaxID=1070528 RepID=A0A6C0E6G4_9ZZZZ
MSSPELIGAAVALFIVAALLYEYAEGFANPPGFKPWDPRNPPVAGRSYNTLSKYDTVPADLNEAEPIAKVPIPSAPSKQTAQLKDLYDLDTKLTQWLESAAQRDLDSPGSLTTEQQHRRIRYQGRRADVRNQLETGVVTDSWQNVGKEIKEIYEDNEVWQEFYPTMAGIYTFGKGAPDALLTPTEYTEFFAIFEEALRELESATLQDTILKVRIQQLHTIRQELKEVARKGTPPIMMNAAKHFLRRMIHPEQTLPTLFSMVVPEPTLEKSTRDVLIEIRDCRVPDQGLRDALLSGAVSAPEGRRRLREMKDKWEPVGWEPADFVGLEDKRTKRLCKQIRQAFPKDADALGCDTIGPGTMATVCDRLRYSVPTVSPEQFGCPPQEGRRRMA